MYNLTLSFRAGNAQASFTFPNSRLSKKVVQNLVSSLTNEPIDTFDIFYCDSEDNITLSVQEDYQNAIENNFQQNDALIYVTTKKQVKFVNMHDYRAPNEKNISKTVSQLVKNVSLQRQGVKLTSKRDQNTKKMRKKEKKEKNRKSNHNIGNVSKQIEQWNNINQRQLLNEMKSREQYLESILIISQDPIGKNILAAQSRIQPNLEGLNRGFIKRSAILNDQNEDDFRSNQLKSRPQYSNKSSQESLQNKTRVKEQQMERQNEKVADGLNQIKEDIIREVLDRLPLYLRQQCLNPQLVQTQRRELSSNIQPICCHCKKSLNAKDKKEWRKQVVNQQLKQTYHFKNELTGKLSKVKPIQARQQ